MDKLWNAGMAGIWREKCSPWNTIVERQSTTFSICGKYFFGKNSEKPYKTLNLRLFGVKKTKDAGSIPSEGQTKDRFGGDAVNLGPSVSPPKF
ncbi:hypothetical protein [Puia dinghuensis]|uniref:hypothetical protein n=1 Tax=Puia dinghuensis TaxID=1792502 RepID=UPI0016681DA9|nr:hypothetical protein [Puia dinghuensis]